MEPSRENQEKLHLQWKGSQTRSQGEQLEFFIQARSKSPFVQKIHVRKIWRVINEQESVALRNTVEAMSKIFL